MPAEFSKACRTLSLLVLLAIPAVARAEVVLNLIQRGTVTTGTIGHGAFTADSTGYSFKNFIWSNDASVTWRFSDAALLNPLNEAHTVEYTASNAAAMFEFVLGGPDYLLPPPDPDIHPTDIAPLFYTWNLVSGTTTFTPEDSQMKITATHTGTVDGGGTFSVLASGTLDYVTSTASFSASVQLFDVDEDLYGFPDFVILSRLTGTLTVVPEPADYAVLLAACAGVVTLWRRRRRADTPA
jgi:hypothetical protein